MTPARQADTTRREEDDEGMETTTASPANPQPVTPPTKRTRHAGHIVAIVAGCLLILPGLALLAGGTAAGVGQAFVTDEDGYFNFAIDRIDSDGVAIAATEIFLAGDDIGEDPGTWVLDWLDVDLRIRAEGAGGTDEVFIGIGRSADVEEYLAGVDHSEIVELDGVTPRYDQVPGSTTISRPTEQDFWATSTTGSGEEEVEWDVRGGRWSIVVMNADGTPGVAADVELGLSSDAVTPVAIALVVTGLLLTAGSVVLIVIGARGTKTPLDPTATARPTPSFDPPSPDDAVQLDESPEEKETSPVG